MTIPKGFVATFAGLIAIYLPAVLAAPTMLSDDRVRNLDITPVLGRGYSIMTNSFLSTCLDHNETSVPSYNYDCKCSMPSGLWHLDIKAFNELWCLQLKYVQNDLFTDTTFYFPTCHHISTYFTLQKPSLPISPVQVIWMLLWLTYRIHLLTLTWKSTWLKSQHQELIGSIQENTSLSLPCV